MLIKLIRHGESEANTGAHLPYSQGDYCINLTEKGKTQANTVGQNLSALLTKNTLLYSSPYWRTRQTLSELIKGAGHKQETFRIYEDPRLREVERGYESERHQHQLRKVHGWFYYRHSGGESPADCYDRTSHFLESLMRTVEKKQADNILIISHGMTIRCFVMRFLHLSVEDFETMKNPRNCDVITIGPKSEIETPVFSNGKWAVSGIRLRPE